MAEPLTEVEAHWREEPLRDEEAGFNAALDADWDDAGARLLYGEFLAERGDGRAHGYLWMAARSHHPYPCGRSRSEPFVRAVEGALRERAIVGWWWWYGGTTGSLLPTALWRLWHALGPIFPLPTRQAAEDSLCAVLAIPLPELQSPKGLLRNRALGYAWADNPSHPFPAPGGYRRG